MSARVELLQLVRWYSVSCAALLLSIASLVVGCGKESDDAPVNASRRPFEPNGPALRVSILRGPRVLLSELGSVVVRSDADAVLFEGAIAEEILVRVEKDEVVLGDIARAPRLVLVRTSTKEPFAVASASAARDRSRYRGSVELRLRRGEVEIINRLSVEEYLLGVIGAEMPALFPAAALEAQTIASRSFVLYALAKRRRAVGGDDPPVFSSTQGFQVYRGVAQEHPRVRAAVEATAGETLRFEKARFSSYFHSTCGGHTAPAKRVFRERDIEPLRGVPCGGCDETRFSSWKSELSLGVLRSAIAARESIASKTINLGSLDDLRVGERAPDGRVIDVELVYARGSVRWPAAGFRMAVEERLPTTIRSTAFSIGERRSGAWTISGSGWGHGVGMCQMGARGWAKKGEGRRAILERYYPGATIVDEY